MEIDQRLFKPRGRDSPDLGLLPASCWTASDAPAGLGVKFDANG
jgi:hypothetical protein